MRDDFLEPRRGSDVVGTLLSSLDVERRLKGRNAVHSALYLWAKTMLPHYILSNLGDRMEMSHSIEGRVPFMDHHVAEYLQRVPVSLKIRGMTEKYILREAVKDVITKTVYERQKHPFLSPPATAGRRSRMSELIRDTLRSDAARSVPFFQADEVRSFADELDETSAYERGSIDTDVMLMVSTILLHERFRVASA